MQLSQAIKNIIDQKGIDIITSPLFYNLLLDYQAFAHRPSKAIMKAFLAAGYGERLLALDSASTDRLLELHHLGNHLVQTHGFKEPEVSFVTDSLAFAMGWINIPPAEPESNQPIQTYSIRNQITVGTLTFNMLLIKGGTFAMGATPEQGPYATFDEKPPVEVTLDSYFLAETLVTQDLWEAIMGSNPSHFKGALLPVERVTWDECQDFIARLNHTTGHSFRLPTEAEWEYAARCCGSQPATKYSGTDDDNLDQYVWHKGNSSGSSHEVAMLQPNSLGLYDLSGNIAEWCSDWYFNSYIVSGTSNNPQGPPTGTAKVYRGGSWFDSADRCRVAKRFSMNPSYRNKLVGLRLAANLEK